MESAPSALLITGLSKCFGDIQAVEAVEPAIPVGSFYGLVGPNGAGKTTLLSMAVGLLRPDNGSSEVLGHDMWTDPVAAKTLLGVLPDHDSLPQRLSGQEMLTYLGLLRGMSADLVRDRSAELFDVSGPGRRGRSAGRGLFDPHEQEDRPRRGIAARPAGFGPGRAVRGRRSGFGGRNALDAEGLHALGRHGRLLQPRDGSGRATLRPRRHLVL